MTLLWDRKEFRIFVVKNTMKNGQSAAKLLSSSEYGERSETISKESRDIVCPETVGLFNAKFYTLNDSDTNDIRYVGRTIQSLSTRLVKHISETKRKLTQRNRKESWIFSLLKKNKKPTINLILEVRNKSAIEIYEIERNLILQYRNLGYNLTNSDDHAILLDLGTENHKKVYKYDIDTKEFVSEYSSAGHAMRETGIHDSGIGLLCKNNGGYGRKSFGGWLWSYEKHDTYPFETSRKDSSKPVLVFKNNNFISEYENARIASKDLNIDYRYISKSCIHSVNYKEYSFKFK